VLGLLMIATLPLAMLIPDAAGERRLAAARKEAAETEAPPGAPREPLATAPVGRSKG
jgi:hypothetical protein